MPHGHSSRRRSNAVGWSSPTSTPRCPSRHCTAPGKCLRLSRRTSERWRCAADRDLRGACCRRDQRHARIAEREMRGTSPALERRPPRRRLVAEPPCADATSYLCDGLVHDRQQRERHRDRGVAIVTTWRDPTRHDRQDRVARRTLVAPARDHDPRRRAIHLGRTTELPIAESVPVQPESPARGPARRAANNTGPRSSALRRRWRREPALDVERVMNDSWRASGRLRHWGRPGARRRRCYSTVGVTYFRRAPRSAPERSEDAFTSKIRIQTSHPR